MSNNILNPIKGQYQIDEGMILVFDGNEWIQVHRGCTDIKRYTITEERKKKIKKIIEDKD
jgi:hypothetical protein